ncbi:MAG: DoxX family protein [Pseudolabrys sp.]|nr:DoxX family protein [Pseudolabrys sp.]
MATAPGDRVRAAMRWILAIFFAAAGIAHLRAPDALLAITPDWVPFAPQLIFITGLFELAAALALVTRPLRKWAGIALAVYAACVFPANIKHAFDGIDISPLPSSWWYHGPRLALQPVIVWWALFSADVIDWPWRRRVSKAGPQ